MQSFCHGDGIRIAHHIVSEGCRVYVSLVLTCGRSIPGEGGQKGFLVDSENDIGGSHRGIRAYPCRDVAGGTGTGLVGHCHADVVFPVLEAHLLAYVLAGLCSSRAHFLAVGINGEGKLAFEFLAGIGLCGSGEGDQAGGLSLTELHGQTADGGRGIVFGIGGFHPHAHDFLTVFKFCHERGFTCFGVHLIESGCPVFQLGGPIQQAGLAVEGRALQVVGGGHAQLTHFFGVAGVDVHQVEHAVESDAVYIAVVIGGEGHDFRIERASCVVAVAAHLLNVNLVEDIAVFIVAPEDAIYGIFHGIVGQGHRHEVLVAFFLGHHLPGVHIVLVESDILLIVVGVVIHKTVDAVFDVGTAIGIEIVVDGDVLRGDSTVCRRKGVDAVRTGEKVGQLFP